MRRLLNSVIARAILLSAILLCASLLATSPALAVDPDEQLADAAMEARARDISKVLRCVVCQSQSIDDSDAPLAKDLRLLVRERIVAGDSDKEVIDYIRARYGDYVLLKPRLTAATALLWAGPFLVLVLGAAGAVLALRQTPRPLSDSGIDVLDADLSD